MIIGLELLHTWLASSNHCSSPLMLTLISLGKLERKECFYKGEWSMLKVMRRSMIVM